MLVVKEGFKQNGGKTNSHDRRRNLAALAGASLPDHCSSEAWAKGKGDKLRHSELGDADDAPPAKSDLTFSR